MGIPENEQPVWDWVESVTGGTIIKRERHLRHRPQWSVDIRKESTTPVRYLLRGMRAAGYLGDEATMRGAHRHEASVLQLLNDTDVSAPELVAYNDELGWILMEHLDGEPLITEVGDRERRKAIYSGYIDNLARLHRVDIQSLDLPESLPVPNQQERVSRQFDQHLTMYRDTQRNSPQPLLELGIQWILNNPLASQRPVGLCGGDVGPNQFTFVGDQFQAMFDLEIAHVGDPLQDIGLMRCREMMYPVGDMAHHVQHYCAQVAHSANKEALDYWTVFAGTAWPLLFFAAVERPPATFADPLFNYAYDTIHRRCIAEALMEAHNIEPDWPEFPADQQTLRSPLYDLLLNQFDEKILPDAAEDQTFFLSASRALVEYLVRCDRYAESMDAQTMVELQPLLDTSPATLKEGMHLLEQAIVDDYQKDFEQRLKCLHRYQARDEFLKAPLQHHFGFASNSPLERMDWRA